MNIFAPIRRLFNMGGLSNPDKGYQVGALERITTRSGVSVTDERSLRISAVWACVQLISTLVASLPIKVYREGQSGREPLKSRHFMTDLLHISPNSLMKPRDFRLAMTVQMCLWNNAYAEITWSGDRPVAIVPLRPGRMTPYIDDSGELTYHYNVSSGVKVYSVKDILHLKGFGTDGIVGVERNNYAREAYGLSVSAEEYAASQFANGGRPGGVLEFSQFLTPDQRNMVRRLYEGISEGAINKNKLWVIEGGAKYNALDFTADQMQMIATRSQQTSEIARFFGVPGILIGAGDTSSSAWPASFEQQMLMFLTVTLQAYLDEWECALVHRLLPRGSDIGVDHDVSGLVKMDSGSRSDYLSKLVQNGLMTRNEARAALNLTKMDGADALTAQVNLTTLDKISTTEPKNGTAINTNSELPTEVRQ